MTDPDIRILRAGAGHVNLVAPLFDAYRRFYGQPSDVSAAREFLLARLRQDHAVIFLATTGAGETESAVGFTQLYSTFSSVALRPAWILNDLYVHNDHRRRGVARRLMQQAVVFARESGACHVVLETGIDNRAAQRLYESLNWKRDEAFYRYSLVIDPPMP